MEKQLQKLLALLAVLSVLFGSAWMLTGAAAPAADGTETLLQEDFSAAKDPEGWSFAGSSHSYQDGWLVTKTGMPYYVGDARWSDYTFTAKMKIVPVETPTATGMQYYGVRFAVDAAANKGVEFCLIYNPANGGYKWRAYDRVTGSFIVSERALTGVTVAVEQELTLQVKLAGTKATFFVNGVQQGQGTATRTLTGGVGTYTSGNTYAVAWFDDITVVKEEPSAGDATLLLDTFNGKSGDLPAAGADWIRSGAVKYDSDGVYLRSAGYALYAAESTAAWSTYSLSARMTFTGEGAGKDGTLWSGDKAAYSGITVGVTDGEGIEFDVVYTGKGFNTRLYDRKNKAMLVSEKPLSADLQLSVGTPMLLRVDYTATRIKGYINGVEVLNYGTEAPTFSAVGSVGIRSGEMRTRFDYVHVESLPLLVRGIQTRAITGTAPNRETGLRFGISTAIVGAEYAKDGESPYTADYTPAEVNLGGEPYSVVEAGAVVTNQPAEDIADGELLVGSELPNVKTVRADKLSRVKGTAEYVVTVVSVPEKGWGKTVRVRPYVRYKNGDEEKIVYGATMARCVNDGLE